MPVVLQVGTHDGIEDEEVGYSYAELSDKAKDYAYEHTDNFDEDYRDSCIEWMKTDAETVFGTGGSWELTYSISFCQGDGVGIEGYIDATDIENPEWVSKILPLLGANKVTRKVGKHTVTWPCPVKAMRIEFERGHHQDSPMMRDSLMELTLVPLDNEPNEENGEYVEDIIVNRYCPNEAPEIWRAVTGYFVDACRKLYDDVTNAILDGDKEGFAYKCEEEGIVFDEDGREIDRSEDY